MYAILFHAHQKIDKVAYRHLKGIIPKEIFFPKLKQIIYFDGAKGPDSAMLKRQVSVEQPWHFINPKDKKDKRLITQLEHHFTWLVESLKNKDEIRSGFEAAWLAHAIVDGLTPAHHYPYEEELEAIIGKTRNDRKGLIGRAFVKSETMSQSIARSLKLIGPKGLVTTHALFEGGAYALIAPLKLDNAKPNQNDLAKIRKKGLSTFFLNAVKEVDSYNLYARFYKTGWNKSISRDIRQFLAPIMVKTVTLAWYEACFQAGKK